MSQIKTRFLKMVGLKGSVRAATTANITLSGPQTIDGVSIIAGDRVLVKNLTLGDTNGIYVAAASTWARSEDADSSLQVKAGIFMIVEEGTAYADTMFILSTDNPITLGTTSLGFTQMGGGGGGANTFLSNLSNPTDVNQNLNFNVASEAKVQTKDDTAITKVMTVKSGDATGFYSGNTNLASGDSDTSSSGQISIYTGDGDTTTGIIDMYTGGAPPASGEITIHSGDVSDVNASPGFVDIYTGDSPNGGTSSVSLYTGQADGTGAGKDSGGVYLYTGDSSSGKSGDIFLTIGSFSTTSGAIYLVDGSESGGAGWVWTLQDTAGAGQWMPNAPGGGANTYLSNLTSPTAVSEDLIFDTSSPAFLKTKDDTAATENITITSGDSSTSTSGDTIVATGTASTTRGKILLDGNYVDANNTNIQNVLDPVNDQDASTKAYTDLAILAAL